MNLAEFTELKTELAALRVRVTDLENKLELLKRQTIGINVAADGTITGRTLSLKKA